jgi:hypothetical protein
MAGSSDIAILRRILEPIGTALSAETAQTLLALVFPPADRERLHALLVKNQAGALTPAEQQEVESYLRVGRVLDLLHSKARQALKVHAKR